MSPRPILANVMDGWNRRPDRVGSGLQTGISAALWTNLVDEKQEVWADPDTTTHIISYIRRPIRMAEVFRDEQHLYSQAVAPGSINVVPAGIRPRAVHDGPWQIGHIYLPRDVVDMLCEQIELESRVVEIVDQGCHPHRSMVDVFEQCISEMRDEDLLSRLKIDGLGLEVALRMLQGFCNVGDRVSFSVLRPARGGLAPWQERRCCEYLRAHLAEDVSLAELAGIANLSPFHFARMFKRTVGVPPHAYQRRLRAERAQELLLATDFSIGDIAAAVGYETPQAFARMFRAETGASPSDWRRERRA